MKVTNNICTIICLYEDNLLVFGLKIHVMNYVKSLLSRHFSEIKAIWLAFDSLNYFTTFEKIIWIRRGPGVGYIRGRC